MTNKPKLLLIFNLQDTKEMNRGQLCAFAGHASMNIFWGGMCVISWDGYPDRKYGESNANREHFDWNDEKMGIPFREWFHGDYRKIVLVTKNPIKEEYDKAVKLGFMSYLQKSSHDGKDKCLAVFGTDEELKEFTKKMEMLK